MTPSIVTDPEELAAILGQDSEAHLYGLADLDEPLWSASTWYRRGEAVVGRISDGTEWVTGYAMSRQHAEATLDLLADVQSSLPAGTWVTGPTGMSEALSDRVHDPKGPHWRMILRRPDLLPPSRDAVPIEAADLPALQELLRSDPGAAFFLPSMLEHGTWHAIWEGGSMVACAGTHVISGRRGVAAIGGVLTHPAHRGRGLGAAVTAAVARAATQRVGIVGLNVAESNPAAGRLYRRIGFDDELLYEEVELL